MGNYVVVFHDKRGGDRRFDNATQRHASSFFV
jgi:hypothetical protein